MYAYMYYVRKVWREGEGERERKTAWQGAIWSTLMYRYLTEGETVLEIPCKIHGPPDVARSKAMRRVQRLELEEIPQNRFGSFCISTYVYIYICSHGISI